MKRFVSGFGTFVLIVLVLLLGKDYMLDHFEMGFRPVYSFRSVNVTHNTSEYTMCTPEMREHMLKKPLPIKMDTNVHIHRYNMYGCFEIKTNESGINRIINERNRIGTKCVPFKKRFLNNTGTEQLVSITF